MITGERRTKKWMGALMALSLIIQRCLTPQMGGLVCSGIAGRFETESVAGLDRHTQSGYCINLF